MAWSGSSFARTNGTYSGSSVWASDAAAGVKIVTNRHDTHDQDLATGINATLNKAGLNTATADLGMGGFKHTNVGSATARTHYPRVDQIQDGGLLYFGTTGGAANVQTATLSPAITAYTAGQRFYGIAGFTNTGSTTINFNGVSANTLKDGNGNNLVGGEIVANYPIDIFYNGTNFYLLSHAGGWASWTPTVTGTGSMTAASTSITYARYKRHGSEIRFRLRFTTTTGGTPSTGIVFTIPVTALSEGVTGSATVQDAGNPLAGYVEFQSTTTFGAFFYDRANWTSGASRLVIASGIYQAA